LKLPPDVEFREDPRLFIWRAKGVINESVVNRIIEFIGDEEAKSQTPFNRFTDTLGVDTIDLNFRYIFHVSLFRRLSYAGRPPVKSAILVPSIAKARYSKLHALLTQGSPLQVRIFEEREAAARWLAVLSEILEH
jgi:hypothetical protein